MTVTVVGAGLAGCEAALQLARRGVAVRLVEMRPALMTPAHRTGDVAELVCSNSLKSDEPANAHGLLKAELRLYGCALLDCAARARVPGGKALVVDRERFSAEVAAALDAAGVAVERGEVDTLPEGIVVVATGPLTSDALAQSLEEALGSGRLFFFDAIAPVVAAESVDMSIAFRASRYGAGGRTTLTPCLPIEGEGTEGRGAGSSTESSGDYVNCPMTRAEYERFVAELVGAELHPVHGFERGMLFEGCLPVEELARRGPDTLAYGPLKPVGLRPPSGRGHEPEPKPGTRAVCRALGHNPISEDRNGLCPAAPVMSPSGRCPRLHAVVQLRQENADGTMFNLVGFQTRLRQAEQRRVFRLIPGLERAEFLRYGAMHRNSYLDAPRVLLPTLQARARADLLVAGQLTGVEGYVESIGAGLVAGVNAARLCRGDAPLEWPAETMLGSLLRYAAGCGSQDAGNDSRPQNGDTSRASDARSPGLPRRFNPKSDSRRDSCARSTGVMSPTCGSCPARRFQPMNVNFGLLPSVRANKSRRRELAVERALAAAGEFAARVAG